MVDIWYGEIKVGKIAKASGAFAGDNKQWRYRHAAKINQAFGEISGHDGLATDVYGTLTDRDEVDTHTSGADTSGGERKP